MMAQTRELFFDAETVEGLPDRVYQAADWPAIFARSFTDGYLDLDEWVSPLLVAASDPAAMTVEVNDGAAWLQGRFFETYDGPQTLVVPEADPANPRIDRVVVRLDLSARTIVLDLLQGTAAGSPSAPALTRTSTIWELSLAQLAIAAGATSVAGANITDERDIDAVCGVAASALESGSSVTVHKAADESVTSSATLQNDDDLVIPIGANEVWVFEIVLFVGSGDESADFKWRLGTPTGATQIFGHHSQSTASADPTDATMYVVARDAELRAGVDASFPTLVLARGYVANGGTAGDVVVNWAQNVSSATATTLLAGSYMVGRKVA